MMRHTGDRKLPGNATESDFIADAALFDAAWEAVGDSRPPLPEECPVLASADGYSLAAWSSADSGGTRRATLSVRDRYGMDCGYVVAWSWPDGTFSAMAHSDAQCTGRDGMVGLLAAAGMPVGTE